IKNASFCYKIKLVFRPPYLITEGDNPSAGQEKTQWRCKYHIVFAPKYRRQIIYGKYKKSIGEIIRGLCDRKNVEIHEANACRYSTKINCISIYRLSNRKE